MATNSRFSAQELARMEAEMLEWMNTRKVIKFDLRVQIPNPDVYWHLHQDQNLYMQTQARTFHVACEKFMGSIMEGDWAPSVKRSWFYRSNAIGKHRDAHHQAVLITEFEVEEESLPKLDALLEDDILVLGLPDWTPPTPPVGDWPELQKTITQQPLVEVNWINRTRNQQYVADIVYEKDGEQQHVKGPEQATMLLNLVDLDPISSLQASGFRV